MSSRRQDVSTRRGKINSLYLMTTGVGAKQRQRELKDRAVRRRL